MGRLEKRKKGKKGKKGKREKGKKAKEAKEAKKKKLAFDTLTHQHFKRTENAEVHRILWNVWLVRKTQKVSNRLKIGTALQQAQAPTIRGFGWKNDTLNGEFINPDSYRDYFLASQKRYVKW